ncbi:MAG: hypothetical protein LBG21_05300 [Campylobacteraceae bacterium]|nr:hypothetical protein [Campylobacteraceae bacterium]
MLGLKFKSLSEIFFSILFLCFFLAGCGGGSSGSGDSSVTNAQTPNITIQPANASYAQGDTANPLSVNASVTDAGVLSYQWYKTSNPNNNGDLISGETQQTYTPSTLDVGTLYYYVVVTNTNNNVNGKTTANITSDTVSIVVSIPKFHSISFYDKNLDFIKTVEAKEGIVDLSNISNLSNVWYEANETLPLTTHKLTDDIRLYAAQNVQEINNQKELDNTRNALTGKYILLDNITLDENKEGFDANGWDPIGNYTSDFRGIFNGNNNSISNLWINGTSTYYTGLFGHISYSQIRNLGVKTANGKKVTGNDYVGIIAGKADSSTITNSYSMGNVNGSFHIGGIVGKAAGSSNITNSYSTGNASGYQVIGGIAGNIENSNIANSYSTENVNGTANYVGGIVGKAEYSAIANSYSTGNANVATDAGGIAGAILFSNITNSYSTGNVNGTDGYAGGIIGYISSGYIQNNAAINPSIVARVARSVNRIVGNINGGTVSNNFALNSMSITIDGSNGNAGANKTITQLKTKATYNSTINGDGNGGLGWKFGDNDTNPWKIDANKNNGYPYLYWQNL